MVSTIGLEKIIEIKNTSFPEYCEKRLRWNLLYLKKKYH